MKAHRAVICLSFVLMKMAALASGNEESCTESMTACQAERGKLSSASQPNNTLELCGALQLYSDCMGPKIEECTVEAKKAFNVVISMYIREPYNCRLKANLQADTSNESVRKQDSNFPPARGADGVHPEEEGTEPNQNLHQGPYAMDVMEPVPKQPDTTATGHHTGDTQTTSTVATRPGLTNKRPFNPSNSSGAMVAPWAVEVTMMVSLLYSMFKFC